MSLIENIELGREFIEHYGRRGMKWGQRKGGSKPKLSSDFKTSQVIRKQKHPVLTNKQIEKANYRANLEQNFGRLNPSKVKKGHVEVKSMLAILGTAASLHTLATSKSGQAAIASGKKALTSSAAKRAAKKVAKNTKQGSLF